MQDVAIVIRVDPDLEDLIPGFLGNRRADVRHIRDALMAADLKRAARIGHTLTGTAGSFGFHGMSAMGRRIEESARHGDSEAVGGLCDELLDYLERVQVVYEAG